MEAQVLSGPELREGGWEEVGRQSQAGGRPPSPGSSQRVLSGPFKVWWSLS